MVRIVPTETTTDPRDRWGEEIRIARLIQRATQDDVARAVELAGPTVTKAERGQGSVETYDRIATHLGIALYLGAEPAEAEAS